MHICELNNSISTLPGVGPAKAALFANLNIFTAGDLLQFYPRNYEDRTQKITIAESLQAGNGKVHTLAKIAGHEWFGFGRMKTLKIIITDNTGIAELVCFNRPFMEKTHPIGQIAAVSGKFEVKYGKYQSAGFEIVKVADGGNLADFENTALPDSKVFPVYPLTEGLTNKIVSKIVDSALKQYSLGIQDDLPEEIIKKRNLLPKKIALRQIHQPKTLDEAIQARNTLVFEELFNFQKVLGEQAIAHRGKLPKIEIDSSAQAENQRQISENDFVKSLSKRQKQLLERLPYKLTPDQMSVIAQMNSDIDKNYGFGENGKAILNCQFQKQENQNQRNFGAAKNAVSKKDDKATEINFNATENDESENAVSKDKNTAKNPHGFSMRSLLQGDVGSGKTLVSFFASLRVADYGSQTALMAPTELLARQHAENAANLLEPLGIRVAYLTGNIKTKGRDNLLKALKNHEIDLVIGTHALFSKNVQYFDLALVIIDEQHRFGVMQRSAILDKGRNSVAAADKFAQPPFREPNLLMMSATPIPQTLALTVFGDLDVLSIHTMPNGRKPVITYLTKAGNERNAYEAVRKELQNGHQAYFVYPAIEANLDSENGEENSQNGKEALKSAEESFEFLQSQVYPDFKCALIHSKVEEEKQNQILNDFRSGKIQVLVATTVVEVGVDVPNATCMVIEQADRFGLAALHQLRGRVGRGDAQSYCFLIYRKNITENGIARMKTLHETTDGFKIAEEDLKLRGPGEITGTVQSGELAFKIADPYRDAKLMMEARADAFGLLSNPLLSESLQNKR
ncbi:MAG: ATP-dependent DNA helicase RecG [Treponema sp.]|nr:ATP-dependent DNA helicase RecG [Treponema sp.]